MQTRQRMEKRAVSTLVLIVVSLGQIPLRSAKADVTVAEPSADSEAPDPTPVESSPAANWNQLSPEAYRAQRDRADEPVNERARRREARTRPEWLVLDDPNSVTPEDKKRVHQAGMLLAAGIPATLAGAFALGFGSGGDCNEGFLGAGVALTTIGLGLDIGGLIALAGTSKKARRQRKSRKHRARMAGTAIGSAVASTAIAIGPGVSRIFACD